MVPAPPIQLYQPITSAGAWGSGRPLCPVPPPRLGALEPVIGCGPVAGHHHLLVGPDLHSAAMLADELDQLDRIGESIVAESDGATLGAGIDLLHPSLLGQLLDGNDLEQMAH